MIESYHNKDSYPEGGRNMKKTKNRVQWLALLGVVGTIFYFLHVILGEINYPGYNPLAQAVSDLTAATAPSKEIASAYSTVYALFTVVACTLFCVFYQGRVNRVFRLGIYLFAVMEWASAVGYTLFPLSASGYAGSFQDIMHMVVTALVVLLSITSMNHGTWLNRNGHCASWLLRRGGEVKCVFSCHLQRSAVAVYL